MRSYESTVYRQARQSALAQQTAAILTPPPSIVIITGAGCKRHRCENPARRFNIRRRHARIPQPLAGDAALILGDDLVAGVFVRRVNRFLGVIAIAGRETEVHIANSGRMRELFRPGAPVWVKPAPGLHRKTQFDLALVEADGVLVSADTRLPNALVAEAAAAGRLDGLAGYTEIRRESTFGDSRLDLRLRRPDSASAPTREYPPDSGWAPTGECLPADECAPANAAEECLVEVKSVTLVVGGVGLFPDSPTVRGVKHLQSLMRAVECGYRAAVVFIVQRPDAAAFATNDPADPPLAAALRQAVAAGVEAYAYACRVTRSEVTLAQRLPIVPYSEAIPGGADVPAGGGMEGGNVG